ncbi:hypothetical protein [Nocardia transvalensis]|uniref:hypothetical protein n=1 Tax=Nocardia transvalensis TaxID=37333 RepID=UPI001893F239|nr:hypothetical protein [Nocardia transvalensis]MBF6329077.1 hypothetical protein [Nocardia transvalensis]
MVSLLASLLVVAAFAAIVYRYAPTREQRAAELLERYRPHAPMSDWSLSYHDEQRQYADLTAISARRESERGVDRMPVRSGRRLPCFVRKRSSSGGLDWHFRVCRCGDAH